MRVAVTEQLYSLSGAVLLGLGLGLLYDLFRVVRERCALPLLGSALDLLFWCAGSLTLFAWSVISGGGVIRIYIALGLGAGCWVWFQLFSRYFLRIARCAADILAKILGICLLPLRAVQNFSKKAAKIFKNLFLSWGNWVKIKMISVGDPAMQHRTESVSEGGSGSENHESQFCHQGGDPDSDRLSVHHPSQREEQNSDRRG